MRSSGGYTLVALLAFMAMAMTLVSAATIVTIVNSQATGSHALGQKTLRCAESGIDNAMLRLLRDQSYTGETLAVGDGTVTITVSGSGSLTIDSTCDLNSYQRAVRATATQSGGTLTLDSWEEL